MTHPTPTPSWADLAAPVILPPGDVLAVIDATIDHLRVTDSTVQVDNLLNTRCAIEDLLAVLESTHLGRADADGLPHATGLVLSRVYPHLRAAFIRCQGGAA